MITQHRIASGGTTLVADIAGQGMPVIFLHAAVCDSRMWQAQLAGPPPGCMAIAYDRRGFGRTPADVEPFSAVADLMAVMDATAGGRPAVLVGCSAGGRIALDAALLHPGRIRALVLIAPSVSGAPDPVYPPDIAAMVARSQAIEASGDTARLAAAKARLWLDGPIADEGRVGDGARSLFLEMQAGIRPAGPDRDAAGAHDRLDEIAAPALVIQGDLDFPHIQARSRYVAAAMPGAVHQPFAGSAHLPSLEYPRQITDRIAGFIAGLPT